MIFLKFLKQQDWRYGIPCILLLLLFADLIDPFPIEFIRTHYLAWHFICATGFLICYSLKFSEKHDNQLIDQLKMAFYFLYFTLSIIYLEDYETRSLIGRTFPFFIFYLYFYTILVFYKSEMGEKGKNIQKSYWLMILVFQSILLIGIVIWAITQKVEAEKQKTLVQTAKEESEKYKLLYDSLNQKK